MIDLKTDIFFKNLPDEIKHLFDSEKPWSPLNGKLKSYFSDNKENVLLGDISPQAFIEGTGIVIEEGAKVEAFAFIKGPCFIGSGSEIRHGAYIRGNVFIGKDCVVGHSTEVKHSIFCDNAKAGHFNYIGDSILGNSVNLGAGTKIANLKITPGTVKLKINDNFYDSGLKKFGALLGDKTETGCNSVLNPGTLLATGSKVYPLSSVSGVYLKKRIFK